MPSPTKLVTDVEDSGVMWGAIIGGAFAAAGFMIILAPLGAAFGFSSISPWHHIDAERAFTVSGAIWLIVVQWLSSGIGGYLTGRLRTEWPAAHTHEVFFRDTVHGFLSWALVTVVGAGLVLFTTVQTVAARGSAAPGGPHEITPTALILYVLSMLVGAFIAAAAGALGGAHRDLHYQTGRLSD